MKLSIIIPAYNNSEYLKPLLDKLMKQKTDEVEIIVVDNGSKEDMSFIDDYDVVSFHGDYCYASGSRNIGLDLAKGEYVTFLDSDDDIVDDYIETHLKNAETGCDYAVYRFYVGKGLVPNYKFEDILWNYNVWSYLYKKSYIGDKRFNEEMKYNEDVDFLKRVIVGGNRLECEKFMVYYNCDNPESLTKQERKELEEKAKNENNNS